MAATIQSANQCTVLSNVTLLHTNPQPPFQPEWRANHHIAWVDGTIVHAGPEPPAHLLMERDDVEVIDAEGAYATPGLIDLQMNGAFGCDFAQASSHQIVQTLHQLSQYGVTSILPTIITAPQADMMASLQRLEEVARQPVAGCTEILGLHVEGPLLNPSYCGIHPNSAMPTQQGLDEEALGQLLSSLCSPSVRMMTLAPECIPMELVLPALAKRRIIPMAGHTGASAETIHQAVDLGLAGVTHLFNAMKGLHHRAPGVVAMALTHSKLMATIIADGHHVYPEALRVAFQSCGTERLALVSDAIHLAGTPEGTSAQFGGQTITHAAGKAANDEGTLAGSATLLDGCIRNVIEWGLVDSATAFAMATQAPAYLLHDNQRGQLTSGAVANIVLWDSHWQPQQVWVAN